MLRAFAARCRRGARVADLGCGPGWYAKALRETRPQRGRARLLARRCCAPRARTRRARRSCAATSRSLPFARESLAGAWAQEHATSTCPSASSPARSPSCTARCGPERRSRMSLFERAEVGPRGFAELARRRTASALDGRLFTVAVERARARSLRGRGLPRDRARARPAPAGSPRRRARNARRRAAPGARAPGRRAESVADRRGDRASRSRARTTASGPRRARAGWIERERDVARGAAQRHRLHRSRQAHHGERERARAPASTAPAPRAWNELVRTFRPRAVVFVGLDGFRRALDPRARARPGARRLRRAGPPTSCRPPRDETPQRRSTPWFATSDAHARSRSSWLYSLHAIPHALSGHAALGGSCAGRVRGLAQTLRERVPRDDARRGDGVATRATRTTCTCT